MPRTAVSNRSAINLSGNLFLRSNTFDNAYWTKGNVTVTPNSAANPLTGDNDAYLFTDDGVTVIHRMYGAVVSVVRNTTYCYSIYVKDNTRRYFALSEDATSGFACVADLQTGTITSTTFSSTNYFSVSFSIAPVAGQAGWYRVQAVFIPKINTSVFLAYSMSSTSLTTGITYAGTGSSVYIYQAQLVRANWAGLPKTTTTTASSTALRNIAASRSAVSGRVAVS
jgi:hypothetical protein